MKHDIAIIGGGIAGLWTLNRLRLMGYDAHLYEKAALGTGQTIASQGIIHGGIKYGFGGLLSGVLSGMPKRWSKCLDGDGEIDLTGVDVLSRKHQVYFKNRLVDIPLHVFPEPVLNVKSLLEKLSANVSGYVHLGPPKESRVTIYTCGIGNEGRGMRTQRRPLRMFMVRNMNGMLYSHYMEADTKPRVTITAHQFEGEIVWYLGGNIAEKAVGMNEDTAFAWALSEMKALFPELRIDWAKRGWAIHDVERAEPEHGQIINDAPILSTDGNEAIAWPTKLALAPILADDIIEWLSFFELHGTPTPDYSDVPPIAKLPWEDAKWR